MDIEKVIFFAVFSILIQSKFYYLFILLLNFIPIKYIKILKFIKKGQTLLMYEPWISSNKES